MRRMRVPKSINTKLDYIKRGYCDQCRGEEVSIVVHHPTRGRPFSICNRCSNSTWVAVWRVKYYKLAHNWPPN